MLFDQDFEVFLADTDAGIALNQQIRYEVFCLEKGFENAAEFPDRQERDQWDDVSVHFVVREKASGHWVGATRIVLPLADRFPVEQHDCLVGEHADGLPRYRLCEVSRMCTVRPGSPTWTARNGPFFSVISGVGRQEEKDVLFGLIRAVMEYGLTHGIEYGYMLITDAFARLLKRVGVVYHQVGGKTEFRGIRTPHFIDFHHTKATMHSRSAEMAAFLERDHLAYRPISSIETQPSSAAPATPIFIADLPLRLRLAG